MGEPLQPQYRQLPTIKLPPRAIDITGARFGLLTAIRPVEKRGQNIVWEMRCDCGRLALRSRKVLMNAKRRGSEPCCQVCLEELRSGALEWRRRSWLSAHSRHLRGLARLWHDEGTLYGHNTIATMSNDVSDDLYDLHGVVPDDPDEQWARRQIEQHGKLTISEADEWRPPTKGHWFYDSWLPAPSERPRLLDDSPLPIPPVERSAAVNAALKRHRDWLASKEALKIAHRYRGMLLCNKCNEEIELIYTGMDGEQEIDTLVPAKAADGVVFRECRRFWRCFECGNQIEVE